MADYDYFLKHEAHTLTHLGFPDLDFLLKSYLKSEPGDVVAAGVYRGGDVMLMKILDPTRNIIVIDSFEGLSSPSEKDNGGFRKGDYSVGGNIEGWKDHFKQLNIPLPTEIYRMWISKEQLEAIPRTPISFCWFDVDLYHPTLCLLERFWPDLLPNGTILIHDYNAIGIQRSCNDFINKHNEVDLDKTSCKGSAILRKKK